jgi:hypothetical protein
MRLSVRGFSAKLGVAARTVTKWESEGVRAQLRPDSHALLDTVYHQAGSQIQARFTSLLIGNAPHPADLDASGIDRWSGQQPQLGRTVDVEGYPPPTMPAGPARGRIYTSANESEDEQVRRRTFIRAFATAGTSGALSMADIETLRHGLVSTMGGAAGDLADWEAVAWEYGRTCVATPPSILLGDLATDLFAARERLDRLDDSDVPMRSGMQRVIALLSVFMAHTLASLGNAGTSYRWWRVARAYAANTATWFRDVLG